MSGNTTSPRVALVGLMGAGKSRVGRLVAAAAGWPFLDADLLVEKERGLLVPQIFAADGESGFRRLESRILAEVARLNAPLVVATGGGVVERPGNRRCLREAFYVVWLRIEPEEAARRLERGGGRPLLQGADPLATLQELHTRREGFYREAADLVLPTQAATRPEDLRDEILDALGGP